MPRAFPEEKNWATDCRGEKVVDRRAIHRTISCCSMQAAERRAFQLLLQGHTYQALRIAAYAPCRRDLYGTAVFGFTQNCSGIEAGWLQRQPQAYPEDYAALRTGGQSAGAQYIKASSGAHQIPYLLSGVILVAPLDVCRLGSSHTSRIFGRAKL